MLPFSDQIMAGNDRKHFHTLVTCMIAEGFASYFGYMDAVYEVYY
jgi:hypothetical protein